MSFAPSSFRPLCRSGGGGRVEWRGAMAIAYAMPGLTETDAQLLGLDHWGQVGSLIYRSSGGFSNSALSGVTRDSTGATLAGCTINLVQGNQIKDSVVSDVAGNFTFLNPGSGPFFVRAYKVGSPDLAGTSINGLFPVVV